MDKKQLTEADIISKYILPAITDAGWDTMTQIRQEVRLRDGKLIVRGQIGISKRVRSADIVLYHKPNMPLVVVGAKANKHEIGKGIQQALDYAGLLDVPFVFASNGDGFIFHDKTNPQSIETEIKLADFPTPVQPWDKYCLYKGYTKEQLPVVTQDYHDDGLNQRKAERKLRLIRRKYPKLFVHWYLLGK